MKNHYIKIVLILLLVALFSFWWSHKASANLPWGVTRHGNKCWFEESKPANINLVYKFPTKEKCEQFLSQENGE